MTPARSRANLFYFNLNAPNLNSSLPGLSGQPNFSPGTKLGRPHEAGDDDLIGLIQSK
jgi:hypothetical protein